MKKTQLLKEALFLSPFFLLSSLCFSQVTQQWANRYNGAVNGFDVANAIAVDAAGNVYVTGSSLVGESNSDYATIKYAANGNMVWVKTYNGIGNGNDRPTALAIDAAGSVYVSGQSEGSGFFNNDYTTIKYDANGNELWVGRYDGPGNATDIPFAMAVDGTGNVYITGSSYGSAFNTDYATIKYSNLGNLEWVSRYDGPGNGHDGAYDLAIDANSNIYITGYSTGSGTAEDYATIKYNSNGAEQWVSRYNGPANAFEQAFSLAVDLAGNVYITGQSFDLAGGSAYATIKYNAAGVPQWNARYHPGVGSDVALKMAIDASGNVYVTGKSSISDSDFDADFATIKYNSIGEQLWIRRYDGPDHDIDQVNDIALDLQGNVYVTGSSTYVQELRTESDYATVKYNIKGEQQWVTRYGGPGNNTDMSTSIALDLAGNVYVTGFSYGDGTDADFATIKYAQVTFCGNAGNKIIVCHGGKPLCIEPGALANHLSHGDKASACGAAMLTTTKSLDDAERASSLKVSHFPNPVSTVAQIHYELPFDGQVSIRVYDAQGRQVATVAEADRKANNYSANFDMSMLPNGLYYYRITLNSKKKVLEQTLKMTVVR